MRVLVNAASIREGGSRVVLSRLLEHMARRRPEIEWLLAAHPSLVGRHAPDLRVTRVDAGAMDGAAAVLRWYEHGLARAVRTGGADVVFSMTNYLPLRRLPCPTLLLIQHAGHFSAVFDRLQRRHAAGRLHRVAWDMKTRWVVRSAQTASILTVQTEALAAEVTRRTGRADVRVIPHGPGAARPRSDSRSDCVAELRSPPPVRIGYITKWGAQKNFAVLFDAVARLRTLGRDVRLVLTLDPAFAANRHELAAAARAGIASVIENHGELTPEAAADLYSTLDVFVFASLAESFGFPLVEAMAAGVPVLAAATRSNREVAGAGAGYFEPHDADELASRIAAWIDHPASRRQAASAAQLRAQAFSWTKAADATLALLDEAHAIGRRQRGRVA